MVSGFDMSCHRRVSFITVRFVSMRFEYQDEPKTAGTADVDDARSRITAMTDWSRWFIVSFL